MTSPMTDAELAEIKHLLETAYCNPLWRKHVSALIAEVDRLKVIEAVDNLRNEDAQSTGNDDRHDCLNDTIFL
ncbi:hypothetical protein Mal52_52890 [Symmachiella dynata]|uniref:Uncharacterized protein n=2 Tax=Symmachiella dynata TaxID=2527995 RepID=A0A517ZW91_9PLAN|nr:hypothetical protein Mal52_52890 [Symmachiella dynata]